MHTRSIEAIPFSYLLDHDSTVILDFPAKEVQWICVWLDGTWIHEEELHRSHMRFGPFTRIAVNSRWNHDRIAEYVASIV